MSAIIWSANGTSASIGGSGGAAKFRSTLKSVWTIPSSYSRIPCAGRLPRASGRR